MLLHGFTKIGAEKKKSKEEKLLGVVIDQKLNFKQHVNMVCTKASQKLHALTRASTYMRKEKTRTVMRAFVMSQFSYCPLIWMFHDRRVNAKINHIHERALRIAYHDRTSSLKNCYRSFSLYSSTKSAVACH